MRQTTSRVRRTPRAGFTLIELLVVVAILAVLAALTTAAVQRVRVTQSVRTAEDVVSKVQAGLDNQVKVIADNVKKERLPQSRSADFSSLLGFCGNDEDRAEALLLHFRLKQNLPQTAAEVPVPPGGFTVGGVMFRPSPAFNSLVGVSGNEDEVSAALLYAALSQRTLGGNTFASDDATSGAQGEVTLTVAGSPRPFRVYRDGWGNPIAFRRFHKSPELDAPPYSQATDLTKNPLDPLGRLAADWPTPMNKATAQSQLANGVPGGFAFENRNTTPLAFSFGLDKKPEIQPSGAPFTDGRDKDDILGYRLRQVGARGFKP